MEAPQLPRPDNDRDHRGVVAIGASGAAGLTDMMELLANLPRGFPGIVLLTLHRPADQPSNLACILQRVSALPVTVARPFQALRAGTCYVGEPGAHLILDSASTIGLVADPWHLYRNRTIDLLFGSVALHAADHAIGVVLSGSLSDGSRGLSAVLQAGGLGMACVPRLRCQGDMPRNAIAYNEPLHCVGDVAGLARAIVTGRRSVSETGELPPPPRLSRYEWRPGK